MTVLSSAVLVLNFTQQCPCDLAGATELAYLTLAAGLIEHQHSWLQGKLIENIPSEEPGERSVLLHLTSDFISPCCSKMHLNPSEHVSIASIIIIIMHQVVAPKEAPANSLSAPVSGEK